MTFRMTCCGRVSQGAADKSAESTHVTIRDIAVSAPRVAKLEALRSEQAVISTLVDHASFRVWNNGVTWSNANSPSADVSTTGCCAFS